MIFLHQPADVFDSVDPEYELRRCDYSDTGITIQDARSYGGGYVINEHGPNWVRSIAIEKSLKRAKAAALSHYQTRAA